MTIRQLCDAGVRYSDGTAGNLLLRDLGGPAQLTAYARSLGDTVTRMDRIEPAIVEATPGDPRDTTSPRAFGADYQKIVLGDALPPDKRAFLRDLLERNATGAGAQRIRAGIPQGWTMADKTGTGDYGTLNDIAVVWPPQSAPLVIAIMSSKATKDAEYDQALIAEAAAYVVTTLT
jgi:beta-lactamase class A